MPEFTKGEIYGGMMKGFAQAFGDAMKQAYPGLPGENGLEDLSKALYK